MNTHRLVTIVFAFATISSAQDFNGDGADDLIVGVPLESVGKVAEAGGINVIYGSPAGLAAGTGALEAAQFIAMNSIGEKPRAGDRFGHAIATGNFNADAYDDAAIGVPFRKVDGAAGSGMVVVIYGGPDGLMSGPLSAVFTQGAGGIPDTSEPGDAFGYALTAGDYNGDGADDLAIGAPFENDGAGQVIVTYGSLFTGLGTGGMTSPQVWSHA